MIVLSAVLTNALFLTAAVGQQMAQVQAAEIPDPLIISIMGIGITSMFGLMAWAVKLLIELTVTVRDLVVMRDDHENRLRDLERASSRPSTTRSRRGDH